MEGNGPWEAIRFGQGEVAQSNNLASLGMNWQGISGPMPGVADLNWNFDTRVFASFLLLTPQPVTKHMEKLKGSRHARSPAFCHHEGASSTHHGIRRPRRVQEDLLMQKPTRGSVKASQARPTNRMMEAENGSTWNGEQARDDPFILPPASVLTGRQKQGLPPHLSQALGSLYRSHPGLMHLHVPC